MDSAEDRKLELKLSFFLVMWIVKVKYIQYNKNEELMEDIESIFEVLEETIDKYYEKVEKAQSKQPDMEW